MNELTKEIGIRIRNRREELRISQEELAKKAGYTSRSSIAKIELGEVDLPQSKIISIADALYVDVGYIMGWVKNPPPRSLPYSAAALEVAAAYDAADIVDQTAVLRVLHLEHLEETKKDQSLLG